MLIARCHRLATFGEISLQARSVGHLGAAARSEASGSGYTTILDVELGSVHARSSAPMIASSEPRRAGLEALLMCRRGAHGGSRARAVLTPRSAVAARPAGLHRVRPRDVEEHRRRWWTRIASRNDLEPRRACSPTAGGRFRGLVRGVAVEQQRGLARLRVPVRPPLRRRGLSLGPGFMSGTTVLPCRSASATAAMSWRSSASMSACERNSSGSRLTPIPTLGPLEENAHRPSSHLRPRRPPHLDQKKRVPRFPQVHHQTRDSTPRARTTRHPRANPARPLSGPAFRGCPAGIRGDGRSGAGRASHRQ